MRAWIRGAAALAGAVAVVATSAVIATAPPATAAGNEPGALVDVVVNGAPIAFDAGGRATTTLADPSDLPALEITGRVDGSDEAPHRVTIDWGHGGGAQALRGDVPLESGFGTWADETFAARHEYKASAQGTITISVTAMPHTGGVAPISRHYTIPIDGDAAALVVSDALSLIPHEVREVSRMRPLSLGGLASYAIPCETGLDEGCVGNALHEWNEFRDRAVTAVAASAGVSEAIVLRYLGDDVRAWMFDQLVAYAAADDPTPEQQQVLEAFGNMMKERATAIGETMESFTKFERIEVCVQDCRHVVAPGGDAVRADVMGAFYNYRPSTTDFDYVEVASAPLQDRLQWANELHSVIDDDSAAGQHVREALGGMGIALQAIPQEIEAGGGTSGLAAIAGESADYELAIGDFLDTDFTYAIPFAPVEAPASFLIRNALIDEGQRQFLLTTFIEAMVGTYAGEDLDGDGDGEPEVRHPAEPWRLAGPDGEAGQRLDDLYWRVRFEPDVPASTDPGELRREVRVEALAHGDAIVRLRTDGLFHVDPIAGDEPPRLTRRLVVKDPLVDADDGDDAWMTISATPHEVYWDRMEVRAQGFRVSAGIHDPLAVRTFHAFNGEYGERFLPAQLDGAGTDAHEFVTLEPVDAPHMFLRTVRDGMVGEDDVTVDERDEGFGLTVLTEQGVEAPAREYRWAVDRGYALDDEPSHSQSPDRVCALREAPSPECHGWVYGATAPVPAGASRSDVPDAAVFRPGFHVSQQGLAFLDVYVHGVPVGGTEAREVDYAFATVRDVAAELGALTVGGVDVLDRALAEDPDSLVLDADVPVDVAVRIDDAHDFNEVTLDWGDGAAEILGDPATRIRDTYAPAGDHAASHVYAADGDLTLTVRVAGLDGEYAPADPLVQTFEVPIRVEDPFVAHPDAFEIEQGQTLNLGGPSPVGQILANDHNPRGLPIEDEARRLPDGFAGTQPVWLRYGDPVAPSHGTVEVTDVQEVREQLPDGQERISVVAGTTTYVPDPDFLGTDTFSYSVCAPQRDVARDGEDHPDTCTREYGEIAVTVVEPPPPPPEETEEPVEPDEPDQSEPPSDPGEPAAESDPSSDRDRDRSDSSRDESAVERAVVRSDTRTGSIASAADATTDAPDTREGDDADDASGADDAAAGGGTDSSDDGPGGQGSGEDGSGDADGDAQADAGDASSDALGGDTAARAAWAAGIVLALALLCAIWLAARRRMQR